MTTSQWLPVRTADDQQLGQAKHHVQSASQWLARLANSYSDRSPDGGHMLLEWDPESMAFVTRPFADDLSVELRLREFATQFREKGERVRHELLLDDHSPAEAEAWIRVELLHRGVSREGLSLDLPYSVTELMAGDANHYRLEPEAMREIAEWYAGAARALGGIAREIETRSFVVSGPHLRPDRLDMVLYIAPQGEESRSEASLDVGMSLGEAEQVEPYFFVARHRNPLAEDTHAGSNGASGGVSAVLPASQIAKQGMDIRQVQDFLTDSILANFSRAAE